MTHVIKYKALGTKGYTPTENKGWYYGTNVKDEYLLTDVPLHQRFSLSRFERMIQGNYIDDATRCIFIGLEDCIGVDIYSGDIIESPNGVRHLIKYTPETASWSAEFYIDSNPLGDCCGISKEWINTFQKKVIGNIFEDKKPSKNRQKL